MPESADACGVGLAALSGDVVESTNCILNKGYNGIVLGVGVGARVRQNGKQWSSRMFWEWWFLTFNMPLLHYDTHTPLPPLPLQFQALPPPPTTLHPSNLCGPSLLFLLAHPWTPPK